MNALKVLSARPALFFRLLGIRLTDFNALVATLHPIWLAREKKRLSRENRKRAIGGGMSYHLKFAEQLLLCLVYYRTYTTPVFMGLGFQCVLSNSLPPYSSNDKIDGGAFPDGLSVGVKLSVSQKDTCFS